MILSRRGSTAKRVGALLCALALILHLAFVPLRVRAFAGVLPAVGAGVVVTAALMASGIYPYEEQKEFAEYVSNNLSALWSQYLDWRTENSMNPPVTGNELSSLTGYLTQGVVAISRNVWSTLSEFTSWIVSYFSVTDNQTGVQLGAVSGAGLAVPFVSASYSSYGFSDETGYNFIAENGVYACQSRFSNNYPVYSAFLLAFSGFSGASAFYVRDSSGAVHLMVLSLSNFSSKVKGCYLYGSKKSVVFADSTLVRVSIDGTTYDVYGYGSYLFGVISGSVPAGQTVYNSDLQALRAFLGLDGSPTFSGVTADITTVSALPALPADTPWGGLAVEGATTAATVSTVEQVIQEGVTEREKPEVKVVDVELGASTDVDTETGEVTENPVVVTPDAVVPSVAELTAPQVFLDALQTTMTTKFPFCLPFDIMRILSALVREPLAPLISLTFHDPFTDADYSVSVDLSPWNDVAAIVRQFESMLLLVGFWLNFDKFNVLNIILGQLG